MTGDFLLQANPHWSVHWVHLMLRPGHGVVQQAAYQRLTGAATGELQPGAVFFHSVMGRSKAHIHSEIGFSLLFFCFYFALGDTSSNYHYGILEWLCETIHIAKIPQYIALALKVFCWPQDFVSQDFEKVDPCQSCVDIFSYILMKGSSFSQALFLLHIYRITTSEEALHHIECDNDSDWKILKAIGSAGPFTEHSLCTK